VCVCVCVCVCACVYVHKRLGLLHRAANLLGKASSDVQAQKSVMSIQQEMLATLDGGGSEGSEAAEAKGRKGAGCGGAREEEEEGGGQGEDDDLVSYDALALGMRLHEQGKFADALVVLRRVLALRRRAHRNEEGGHPEIADVLVEIAKVLLAAGEGEEETDQCREMLQEALQMRQKAFGAVHREVALVYSLLGHTESDCGDHAQALHKYLRYANRARPEHDLC
jgi:tetratricopeptide (TPR) repeat protein